MKKTVSTIVVAFVTCWSAAAVAQVPIQSSGLELAGNARSAGIVAQWRDDRTAAGAAADVRFDARRVRFGPTLSETLIRRGGVYELRAPLSATATTFLERERWSVGGAVGLRNVLRSRHALAWLGSELDMATTVAGPVEQRFTPGLELGFSLGGFARLPALAVRTTVGYTIGGQGRGALVAESWFSLVFDRWFDSIDE